MKLSEDPGDQRESRQSFWRRAASSLRAQLLLAVNLPLAALVAIFFVYDYRSSLDSRVSEKSIDLQEEAKTLLPAVMEMRSSGLEGVQAYVDSVCSRMQANQSPGHHIVVESASDGTLIQANAHQHLAPGTLAALRQAGRSEIRGLRRTGMNYSSVLISRATRWSMFPSRSVSCAAPS